MNNNQNNQKQWWESTKDGNADSGSQWESKEESNANGGAQWENTQGNAWWEQTRVNFPPFFTSAQQEMARRKATTAMILGIVGLVLSLFILPLAGIILGIIALVKASTAQNLSPTTPFSEAKAGKILGILSIVLGALPLLFTFVFFFIILSFSI